MTAGDDPADPPAPGRDPSGAEIVTFGEVMALFLAETGRPLAEADRFGLGFAGAEATVAVGLARLGHRVRFAGLLGDDALGRRIRRELGSHGVLTADLRLVPGAPTGLLVRDAAATGPISVEYYRSVSAASRMRPGCVPEEAIRSASVLHVTGITAALSPDAKAATLHAARVARAAGVMVSFDPNVRRKLAPVGEWRAILDELAPLADVVLTGVDDARVVTDGDPAAWFLDRGATTVVVKDGARGCCETDGVTSVQQPAMAVTAVDPVGAGDAFAAGWLHGRLTGQSREERLRLGAAVAALAVAVRGDVPGLPTRVTLQEALLAGFRTGAVVESGAVDR